MGMLSRYGDAFSEMEKITKKARKIPFDCDHDAPCIDKNTDALFRTECASKYEALEFVHPEECIKALKELLGKQGPECTEALALRAALPPKALANSAAVRKYEAALDRCGNERWLEKCAKHNDRDQCEEDLEKNERDIKKRERDIEDKAEARERVDKVCGTGAFRRRGPRGSRLDCLEAELEYYEDYGTDNDVEEIEEDIKKEKEREERERERERRRRARAAE